MPEQGLQAFQITPIFCSESDHPGPEEVSQMFSSKQVFRDIFLTEEVSKFYNGFVSSAGDNRGEVWSCGCIATVMFLLSSIGLAVLPSCSDPLLKLLLLFSYPGFFAGGLITLYALANQSYHFVSAAITSRKRATAFFSNSNNHDKWLIGQAAKAFNQRAALFRKTVQCVQLGTLSVSTEDLQEFHVTLTRAREQIVFDMKCVQQAEEACASLDELRAERFRQSDTSLASVVADLESLSALEILQEESLRLEAHRELDQELGCTIVV